jgi:hypothetical protein
MVARKFRGCSSSGNTKKYSALNFVGVETIASPINATSMTHFHTDIWSSDFTEFKVKLVDLEQMESLVVVTM